MQSPLKIDFENTSPSEFVERRIRERVARLERIYHRIVGCSVTVEAPHKHHNKGNLYRIKIVLQLPGASIAVNRDTGNDPAHDDVYVAIRDAFDAASRRLSAFAARQRGEVKSPTPQLTGQIGRLFTHEGYGFISMADGTQVYFHRNSVTDGAFERLQEGQAVRLVVAEGEGTKGPQASTVAPTRPMRLQV